MYYYNNMSALKPPNTRAHSAEKERQQLAQSYVPAQAFHKLYSPLDSLKYGTMFEELNLTYGGKAK